VDKLGTWFNPFLEEANMWTRRVLLATMVAAAAMSLPRAVPASWNAGLSASNNTVAVSALR
jgi:hypothetical protein